MAEDDSKRSSDQALSTQSAEKADNQQKKKHDEAFAVEDSHAVLPDIESLNADAFNSLVTYVQEDLSSVAEDYKLLEKMNRVAISKYLEMKEISTSVHIEMIKINDKYRNLAPYLEQIDQIEDKVAALEEVAYRLDAYSKRLEAKFKQLEKR